MFQLIKVGATKPVINLQYGIAALTHVCQEDRPKCCTLAPPPPRFFHQKKSRCRLAFLNLDSCKLTPLLFQGPRFYKGWSQNFRLITLILKRYG